MLRKTHSWNAFVPEGNREQPGSGHFPLHPTTDDDNRGGEINLGYQSNDQPSRFLQSGIQVCISPLDAQTIATNCALLFLRLSTICLDFVVYTSLLISSPCELCFSSRIDSVHQNKILKLGIPEKGLTVTMVLRAGRRVFGIKAEQQ